MAFLIAILTLVLVGLVMLVVGAPLRRARRAAGRSSTPGAPAQPDEAAAATHRLDELEAARALDELEAAREAKYREIRDAELDFRTGKLSPEDYRAIDAELRAEAIAILDSLQALTPGDAGEDPLASDA